MHGNLKHASALMETYIMKTNELLSIAKIEVIPPQKLRSLPLTTVGHVRSELASIYRLAKAGSLPLGDASRLTYILVSLGKLIETSELESRVKALEAGGH